LGNAQKRHALAQVQLNVIGELPSRKMRDSEIFKDLISGAEGIQAKSLYKDEYKFSARFGCVCATNKMFESDDTSGGLMRRIMFIAFSQKFDGKRRREEFTELVQGPGIYAWAMEGLTRLLAQGHYSEPESHAAKMEEWSDDQDPVSEWTRLHTEPTEAPTRARDLYANFMTWYHDKWGPGVMDKKEFCRTLKYNRVKNSGGDSWYPISIKK
jgi:phage/plasmid-associated DNA primase